MKYRLDRINFKIYKHDIYLLPTIRVYLDDMVYMNQNFSIELHFLVFHARLLFMGSKT